MKQSLLSKIAVLGKELPLNTLDELIDKFGGPDKVSEVRVEDTEPETPQPPYTFMSQKATLSLNICSFADDRS